METNICLKPLLNSGQHEVDGFLSLLSLQAKIVSLLYKLDRCLLGLILLIKEAEKSTSAVRATYEQLRCDYTQYFKDGLSL